MPIYVQSYRSFDGKAPGRFRWWIVIKQEIRVLTGNRWFLGLVLVGYLQVLLRLFQIIAVDTVVGGPNNPVVMAIRNLSNLAINSTMFFDFIRLQGPIVFLTTIFAGSGMISTDFQNNLTEVYFSKPLRWPDYVLGKVIALTLIGLGFTAFPGIILLILHNILAPGWETFNTTYWLAPAILAFSCVLVVPCALGVLASSSIFTAQRYAAVAIFALLFCDLVIGRALPELMHERNFAIIAFPLAINRIGESIFAQRRPLFDLSWPWSALFAVTVCLVCLIIICAKARRAEVAA